MVVMVVVVVIMVMMFAVDSALNIIRVHVTFVTS